MDFSERIKDSYSFFGKRLSNRFLDWFGAAVNDIWPFSERRGREPVLVPTRQTGRPPKKQKNKQIRCRLRVDTRRENALPLMLLPQNRARLLTYVIYRTDKIEVSSLF